MKTGDATAAASQAQRSGHEAGHRFTFSFGAHALDDGSTQFRVWAPSHETLTLEIEGYPPVPMRSVAHGFHEAQTWCATGSRYRYRIRPELAVPDPASRLQDGDVHSASLVTGRDAYPWAHPDWRGRPWNETVLYELHPGVAGGFTGLQQRLARLAELGITAVELMPIADFPGLRNWGYDGVLPYAPDTAYGTPEQLKSMIDTAHGLGIMVFLDVVYNHFGPDGNYLFELAPEFFRTDRQTPWGPAIDFRRPEVRRFFAENALYWLTEYRFDGLRLDAVHAIGEQDWLPEMAQFVRRHVSPERQVHLVLENDDNVARLMTQGFDAQWNDDGHHILHHLLTGETQGYYMAYADHPAEKLARFLSDGFIYQGQPSPWRKGAARGEPSTSLPPTAFVLFLQNHDQIGNRAMGERLASLLCGRPHALRAAIALQLLCPQIPLIFMGEECGATTPFFYFTDYRDPHLAAAVRDGRRKEFADFHAMAGLKAQNDIPDPNAPQTFAALAGTLECDDSLAQRWQAYYRLLLTIRTQFITTHLAPARSLGAQALGPAAVAAQWRLANGSVLTLHVNLGETPIQTNGFSGQDPVDHEEAATVLFESIAAAASALQQGALWPECAIATLRPALSSRLNHA